MDPSVVADSMALSKTRWAERKKRLQTAWVAHCLQLDEVNQRFAERFPQTRDPEEMTPLERFFWWEARLDPQDPDVLTGRTILRHFRELRTQTDLPSQ